MEVFDEDKAIKYILSAISQATPAPKVQYHDDDILEVIDIIWDYYEDNGFLDVDMDDDSDGPETAGADQLIAHVTKMIRKDRGSRIDPDDIPAIVNAELAYEALCDGLD